jgi:hypothetical protein
MRNYKKEYRDYHGKPEQIKRRAGRNAARRQMTKLGMARKGDGKDVDHKDRNPQNNSRGNLRMQSKSQNRSRNSNKTKLGK